jgi:peroxiredoxin
MNAVALLALASISLSQETTVGQVCMKPEDVKPIGVGALVPDVPVVTADGETKSLRGVTNGVKTVLVFYRGGWCPFCTRHMAELGKIKNRLEDMDYQIVAISPDKPSELMATMEKNHVDYTLLSDSTASVIKAFGLAYKVDDATVETYRSDHQIDLERASGMRHHILPVPALYLVGANGIIKYAHWDPNYESRLDGEAILRAAAE